MSDQTTERFAIVVDDEGIVRKMMAFALRQEGFVCHAASDGEEAMQLIESREYHLVVTDLAMPHKNGHALAVELLARPNRPTIAVHTAIVEPKITKDLMNRGVDDIIFKPTDYAAFAAKIRGIVDRRLKSSASDSPRSTPANVATAEPVLGSADPAVDPSTADVPESQVGDKKTPPPAEDKASAIKSIDSLGVESLPFSQAALDVCRLACDDDSEADEIAEAIELEPTLMAELLRLGNSSFYNRSGRTILSMEEIIVRIGRRHIGELALALNACSSMRDMIVPSLDVKLAWHRSLAAHVAIKQILSQRTSAQRSAGLMLSAAMHLLGRMVLAKKFPDDMATLTELAEQTGESLTVLERRTFSASQSEILARLLSNWQVPDDVIGPLRHFDTSYEQLVSLDRLDREDAELVKIAVLIGWLAVGKWDSWDAVEIPSPSVFRRHCNSSPSDLVHHTRAGLVEMLADLGETLPSLAADANAGHCIYRCLGERDVDFIRPLLPSLGLTTDADAGKDQPGTIVNCIDASSGQVQRFAASLEQRENLILGRNGEDEGLQRGASLLLLPCTFGKFTESTQSWRVSETRKTSDR